MSVKKNVQKKSTSLGLSSKKNPKKSILKNPSPKLQLASDSDSDSEVDSELESEVQSNSLTNKSPNLSNGASKNSDVSTDDSDSEDGSYDGDYDEESATDDESIISCGESGTEQEDDMEDQENDNLQDDSENTLHVSNNASKDDPTAGTEAAAPSKQQQALANVMGSLLKKKKSVVELMNKPKSTSKENERKDLVTEKGNNKRKKGQTDNVLEIVGEDGTIEKVKVEQKPSKKMRAAAEENKEIAEPGKRHFPINSRTDPYCQDPYLDSDVVKEKKLRSLATQGVVQLFNTLEQFRQQGKDMAAAKPGRMAPKHPEVSAITSGGKAGLIDFLMKKGKGGAGLPTSRTADRPLFSEVKREEGPLESR